MPPRAWAAWARVQTSGGVSVKDLFFILACVDDQCTVVIYLEVFRRERIRATVYQGGYRGAVLAALVLGVAANGCESGHKHF